MRPPRTRPDRDRDRPHVALIVETSINYGRGVLRGIARYLRESGPWSVFLEQRELGAELPAWIDRWDGDGIITRSDDPRLLGTGIPTVALFDRTGEGLGLPRILNDGVGVGRLAAQHLIDRGFQSFGYYGLPGAYWSELRRRGARELIEGLGGDLRSFRPEEGRPAADWESQQNALAGWVAGLPGPLGLIAANDVHGLRALDACRRAGLPVPEEVAVVGADNDEELCELSDPPLSSVAFHPERVGREAAALLHRLMAGEPPPRSDQIIPPLGVVARQSTDVLAIPDPDVAQALHLIRRRACSGLDVPSVLAEVAISRRSLEQRFRKLLGRSPKAEIRRIQVERAKALLAETDLPVASVGRRAGFDHPAYFASAFRRETGMTPSHFRLAGGRQDLPPG